MDPFSLTDRAVLLTGAAGGIGGACARLLARAGARLVLTDKRDGPLQTLAAELRALGSTVDAIPCDLGDSEALKALAREATTRAGPLDGLICNGGMEGHVGPIGEASDAAIEGLLSVNLKSAIVLTGALAPGMAERGHGSIVLVASIAGLRGNKGIGLYGVTKAGLAQLARNLAVEWGPSGVRANTVSPGLIRTPFARPILENTDYLPRRLGLTPLRRAGEPDEIAATIVFLIGDGSGFITGHNLIADGGTTISDGN